jgi:hypothetical protein
LSFGSRIKAVRLLSGIGAFPLVKISCGKPIVTEEVSMPVSKFLTQGKHHQV